MSINKILQYHRKKHRNRYTQQQLAIKIGVAPSAVSNWESGRIPIPGDAVIRLCLELEIDPNQLFGWYNIYKE